MNPWAWTGIGVGALFLLFVVWPVLAAGRQDDYEHGRLEEQQSDHR